MATDKTPAHKRIQRAEAGRDDWKWKATLRREEIEKLKRELQSKEASLAETIKRNRELEDELIASTKKISEQNKMIDNLKKKA